MQFEHPVVNFKTSNYILSFTLDVTKKNLKILINIK